jgi:hypothetical protein
MHKLVSKDLCWLMSFVLLVTWSGLPSLDVTQAAPQPGTAELHRMAERLEKMFEALEAAQREIPRDTFDLKAIVEKVGRDPQKLFAWVRDHTYLVPYRGALRGWQGVLMDRLGNSLDRALLLEELLYEAGYKEARLAYARLSKEQARVLLEKARPVPAGGALGTPRPSRQELDVLLAKYAQHSDLDRVEFRNLVNKVTLQQQRLAEEAVQRTVDQAAVIAAAVEKFRVKEEPEARVARLAEALQDHWWVQWYSGSQWRDLDPSLPDTEPGRTLAQAQETFQGNKLHNRLYDEVHLLQIRVIIERWEEGRLVEVPVLTQQLWPFHLIEERIAIYHAPMNWPTDLDMLQEKDPLQTLKTAVLTQSEWVPVLSVGPHQIARLSFTDSGELNDPTLPSFVQTVLAGRELVRGVGEGARVLGARVGDMLRGSGVQQEPVEEPRRMAEETNERLKVNKTTGQSQLTAEWIEYEIRRPGEASHKIRRQIFDLIGPAARAAGKDKASVPAPGMTESLRLEWGLALVGKTEVLLQICQLSPEFILNLATQSLLANRKLRLDLLRQVGSADLAALADQARRLHPIPKQLYGLALARREWSRFRGDVYLDRLNILSHHTLLREEAPGELRQLQGFDIVTNNVTVHPRSQADPFRVRLEQGVLDTNAEAFLTLNHERVENTAELFARASNQGVRWLTIPHPGDSAWREAVELPEDVRTRIKQDLTAGYVVVAPKKAVSLQSRALVGWWRVDPSTGQTLGIGERGWGQTATDRVLLGIVLFGPQFVFTYYAYTSCRGRSASFGATKDWLCLACAFLAGACLEVAWLAFLHTGVPAPAGVGALGSVLGRVERSLGFACMIVAVEL